MINFNAGEFFVEIEYNEFEMVYKPGDAFAKCLISLYVYHKQTNFKFKLVNVRLDIDVESILECECLEDESELTKSIVKNYIETQLDIDMQNNPLKYGNKFQSCVLQHMSE